MSLLNEDIVGSFSQCISVFIREGSIASFDKIMVESTIGVFWRTDGHHREVQVVDGMGGDRGGNRVLLPLFVRLAYEDSSNDEPKTNHTKPENLSRLGLNRDC